MSRTSFSVIKSASIGGGLSALVIFLGTYLLGNVSDAEAIDNLQEIRPTLRFTASGSLTATSTILALMLTLLSFSQQSERRLKAYHYNRIWWIARFAAIVFVAALILLMTLNVPINNAHEAFHGWYNVVYYTLLVYTALMGGLMITIILLLYQAARDIILIAHPDRIVKNLYAQPAEEEEEEAGMLKREREAMHHPAGKEEAEAKS